MAKVIAGDRSQRSLLVAVHGGFGGLHVMRRSRLHLDKTKYVIVPTDQIDLPAMVRRMVVTRHHDVSFAAKMKISSFLTPSPGPLMRGNVASAKSVGRKPIETTDDRVGQTAMKHGFTVGIPDAKKMWP